MKMNRKNVQRAIVHTFFDLYSVHQLASRVVDELDEKDVGSTELHSVKQSGFTIRCKKDSEVEDSTIHRIIKRAMTDMLDDRSDEAVDSMLDNYDIALDLDDVDTDMIRSIFDISHNGRLIIVEIDE